MIVLWLMWEIQEIMSSLNRPFCQSLIWREHPANFGMPFRKLPYMHGLASLRQVDWISLVLLSFCLEIPCPWRHPRQCYATRCNLQHQMLVEYQKWIKIIFKLGSTCLQITEITWKSTWWQGAYEVHLPIFLPIFPISPHKSFHGSWWWAVESQPELQKLDDIQTKRQRFRNTLY